MSFDYNQNLVQNRIAATTNDLNDILKNSAENNTLCIVHLNIRSINKNFEELEAFLQNISLAPDVLVLSETWKIYDTSLFQLKNYNSYYNNSTKNQNDGLIIYIKSNLIQYSQISKINNTTFLNTTIKLKENTIGITGVYRSPNENETYFLESLESYLSDHCKLKNEVIIGDTNINTLQFGQRYIEDYKNLLAENGFIPLITSPTRVAKTSSK